MPRKPRPSRAKPTTCAICKAANPPGCPRYCGPDCATRARRARQAGYSRKRSEKRAQDAAVAAAIEEYENALRDGNWVLDPIRRIQVWRADPPPPQTPTERLDECVAEAYPSEAA